MAKKKDTKKQIAKHRFLDEAGDTTFYGKGNRPVLGSEGVSNCFILGMVKFTEPLEKVRNDLLQLQTEIAENELFQVPSLLKKKMGKGGYYLHATDDIPEVRLKFFEYIKKLDCSFEAVVGRKSLERYDQKHKGKEEYFYADMLSHLLKTKLSRGEKLILHISERGKSTKNTNLDLALKKAIQRFRKTKGEETAVKTEVIFNVNYPTNDPLLNVADYFCWAIQRVFEKGELRYYNYLKDKISLVVDIYDNSKYEKWGNYYSPKNPLTVENKISPPLH
jgi:hypothetical protein